MVVLFVRRHRVLLGWHTSMNIHTAKFSNRFMSIGWKAPRNSTALVYSDGMNKTAIDDELNISFNPSLDYTALVEAAAGSGSAKVAGGWMKGVRVSTVKDLGS
ncbi:hypothetical protein ACMFMG_003021 [Clarireedia jacksonii]